MTGNIETQRAETPASGGGAGVIKVFALPGGGCGNSLGLMVAEDLTSAEMQSIATELGHSETIFLTATAEAGEVAASARIFTPGVEVPFAGHPMVGAAWHLGRTLRRSRFVVTTPAGAVRCWFDDETDVSRIEAPQKLSRFEAPSASELAACLSLGEEAFASAPMGLSIGLPFVVVELRTRQQLREVQVQVEPFRRAIEPTGSDAVLCWTRSSLADRDIDARMFSPLDGIGEDPATGSACGALAANLAATAGQPLSIRVRQGEDMGEPCEILIDVDAEGQVALSGRCFESQAAPSVKLGG